MTPGLSPEGTPSGSEATPDPASVESLPSLLRTARAAADAACRVHRRHAGRVGVAQASEKGTSDFVSHVDLESQRVALEVIRSRHPDHSILAEETDEEDGGGGVVIGPGGSASARGEAKDTGEAGTGAGAPLWIVDPLDGTTNFLNGHPMYCASVAVYRDGEPLAGAVSSSPTSERWWAGRGLGAFKDGRPIRVSGLERLSHALVGTGFPFKALDELPPYLDELGRVLRATAGVRRGGSAALDLCYLADGTFDGFWERHLKPWDVAAGILIVREAGGLVTRIDGSGIGFIEPVDGTVLGASTSKLHRRLGAVVRGDAD